LALIACDFDGVLADTHTAALRVYNQWYGTSLTPDDLKDYYFPHWERFGAIWHHPTFYQSEGVQPIPGAIEAVHRLRAAGHRVVIVSACAQMMSAGKTQWLEAHGLRPFRTDDQDFIAASDKTLIRAALLIDDAPHHVADWARSGRRAILFDQPWNRRADLTSVLWSWIERAQGWPDVLRAISGDAQAT